MVFSEVHELLTKIYDILDKTVSKQVGNTAYILAYLLNFASMQHGQVWVCSPPFFTILRTEMLLMRLAFMVALTGI